MGNRSGLDEVDEVDDEIEVLLGVWPESSGVVVVFIIVLIL